MLRLPMWPSIALRHTQGTSPPQCGEYGSSLSHQDTAAITRKKSMGYSVNVLSGEGE